MQNCILAAVLLTAIAAPTSATGMHDAEDRSAEAVQRADDAWGKAEAAGDSRYVDWLLLPDYVSIGPDGRVHDKAAIVSHTKARRQGDAETAASIAAWRLAHPYRTQIRILGDTAIVSFISTKNQSAGNVNSSDIFVYRGGHWHAAYSQHSAAESV